MSCHGTGRNRILRAPSHRYKIKKGSIPSLLTPDVPGHLCFISIRRASMATMSPERPMTIIEPQTAELPYTIMRFPLKYPGSDDTLILDTISSNIWPHSGQHSDSAVRSPFRLHLFCIWRFLLCRSGKMPCGICSSISSVPTSLRHPL